jgi:predicted O-linked N-acetylglucosamine transferase (SPINDLY family)
MNQISPIVSELDRHAALVAQLSFNALLELVEREGAKAGGQAVIRLYQLWIAAHPPHDKSSFIAWFNLGATFAQEGDSERALTCYEAALARRPDMPAAAINAGLLLEASGRKQEALDLWRRCLQPVEARVALLNNHARLSETMGRLAEAEADLRASLMLAPDQPDAIQHFVHIRQKSGRWPVLDAAIPGLDAETLLMRSGPLAVLALTDDVAVQSAVCAQFVARKTSPVQVKLSPAEGYDHQRVHIGFLSSDFCSHAMSYLIAELLERLDRRTFKVFGYCSSPEDGSAIRTRVLAALDKVTLIRALPDAQAAKCVRDDEIDVLIDLNGLTAGSRLQLLRYRPAPVQASYLGFVGPVPAPELDYLLCDDFVVPPDIAGLYAPTPLALGPIYQANDSRREIGPTVTRREIGLPEDRFVFCCFSNHYKITEAMFAAWMTILHAAEGAVLWLADDGSGSRDALLAHAAAAGIDPARLIFTGRVAPGDYLARLRLADLFLDTFPYNAGTVASDAIRMQVPLLTLAGRSFASRMAARLLLSVDAPEGIAETTEDYVARATRLACDPAGYAAYKARFTEAAWQAGPCDVGGFVEAFSATISRIVKRPRSVA